MKKILITGANSYIGTSFEAYIKENYPNDFTVDTLDMLDGSWRKKDFSGYDVVFHVAGIAHSNPKAEMKDLYYKVNTDLAIEVAERAKESGVKQFIFMSSIIVYGSRNTYIDKNTIPEPENFYGDSKLQADIKLHKLESENFKVVSIRPPMIYGKGSKGNYPRLSKMAKRIKIFPSVKNQRSMLHIDNLCEFIRLIIDNNENGYFHPQNREYVSTLQLVKTIAAQSGNRIMQIGILNPLFSMLSKRLVVFNKVFGNLVYDKKMSDYMNFTYCVNDFKETIKRTEK